MAASVRLRKNQDRRVRAGHPWIFSNEISQSEGDFEDGDVVDVLDARGAYLGRGYANRNSLIAVRILTRGREEIDRNFFRKRIQRALDYRLGLYPDDTAVRLVSSEGDFLPGLVVDRYADVLSVMVNTLGMDRRAEIIREVLEELLAPRAIVLRADSPFRSLEGLAQESRVWTGEEPGMVEVSVGGVRYQVDPVHGQKTGFFLDQRDNRRRLAGRVSGKRVLDAFSYTGAWGLTALSYGAGKVVLVDSSKPALELAHANAALNGFADRVEMVLDNAFQVLPAMVRARERFDVVICDPPALVKSKKKLEEGLKMYRHINHWAMELVGEGGWLFTSSCSHAVGDEEFRGALQLAARDTKRPFRLVEWGMQSLDHPVLLAASETAYLKCAVLRAG